jgi:hypothetical protein
MDTASHRKYYIVKRELLQEMKRPLQCQKRLTNLPEDTASHRKIVQRPARMMRSVASSKEPQPSEITGGRGALGAGREGGIHVAASSDYQKVAPHCGRFVDDLEEVIKEENVGIDEDKHLTH